MSEEEDAIGDLEESGALGGIRWAADTAYERLLADYDPATGHDQGWIGYTAHKLICDRLNRVFSCGDYLAPGDSADAGLDILAAGLKDEQWRSMPRIPSGTVIASNLNNSPGWRSGGWRCLLASYPHGKVDKIPWPQKSPTKRRVASQPSPNAPMLPFEDDDPVAQLFVLPQVEDEELEDWEGTTLVIAHSVHPDFRVPELFIGRPRLNLGGGPAWWWKRSLLLEPPPSGGGINLPTNQPTPQAPAPNGVPDAPVRLRRKSQEGTGSEAIG